MATHTIGDAMVDRPTPPLRERPARDRAGLPVLGLSLLALLGALFESTTGLKLRDLIASQQATSAAPRNASTPSQPPEVVVATAHVDGQP